MARIAIQKSNFTAGELKPTLHAREDLAAYQNGAKYVENRIPLPEGGAIRRSGTRLVTALLDETNIGKLMPFKFSRTDARVLILSGGYAKVGYSGGGLIQSGGVDYKFALPARWVAAAYPNIRYTESANAIFAADGLAKPQQINRLSDTNWTIQDYAYINGPNQAQNTDTTKTIIANGVSGSVTLTANFNAFQPGHVGSIWRLDEANLGSIPYWTANEQWGAATLPTTVNPTFYRRNAGAVYCAVNLTGTTSGASISGGVNAPTQLFGDQLPAGGQINGAGPSLYATWRFMYQDYAYVKITAYTDAQHVTATVLGIGETSQTVLPDSLSSASTAITPSATYRWWAPAWSDVDGWPTLTAYCQQRMGFLRGYQFWLSNSGDNYRYEVTTADDSAISGALLSVDGTVLQPQWTYSSGWIVVGCSDCEPVIRGPNMFDALTQTDVLAVVDKGQGSAWHVPAIVDAAVINIGVSRQRLHYTKINRLIDTIQVDEISVNSNHVLAGLAAGVAYQHDPNRVCWGYSQNGDLWSYTFRPDQSVIAAARHPMPNGYVEDMCCIPTADGTGVELWMIVRRVINGATRRFVEVMQPFFQPASTQAPDATGAWYVDCALPYSGAPTNVLNGLNHLAGATARVFGDGSWVGDLPVSVGGSVALPRNVSNAVAGLPIKAKLRTLPLDPTRPGSTTRGDVKQASHGAADFLWTFGGDAKSSALDNDGNWQDGTGVEDLFPSGMLSAPPTAVSLFTGRKSFPMDGPHGVRVELEIEDDHPYPSTILALAPDIEDDEV